MAELAPGGYVGTPSFLKIILDKSDELGVALKSVTKALVSGEAFRRRCEIRSPRAESRRIRRTRPPTSARLRMSRPPAKA